MISASHGATIASTVRKWVEGLPERAGNARGRTAEVERVRSQQPAGPGEAQRTLR